MSRLDSTDRGQSELIGIVLLFGLVVVTATSVFVIGGIAVNDVTEEVDLERALTEMRQADSRMSRVAFGQQGGQVVVFGESDSAAEVQKGSSLTVTLHGNSTTCTEEITMGSIVKQVDGGGTIAYEGGGVWRESGGGVTMVSPPDLQYQNGSVTFPMVSLANATSGQVNSLQVTKDANASRERNEEIAKTFANCAPPKNMTISVQSDYYEGWGQYMEERIASNVTYHDGSRTVTTTLDRVGGTWSAGNSSVQVDRNFSATVEVLGTELSAGDQWCEDWDGIDGSWECVEAEGYIQHAPVSMTVIVDGEQRRPWSVNPDAGHEGIRYNVNDPSSPGEHIYSFSGDAGTNITVEATSWFQSGFQWVDETVERDGIVYDQYRADGIAEYYPDDGERISIDSSEDDEKNLAVLEDGDELPSFGEASSYQRSMEDMLGSERIGENENGTKVVVLEENQAVFVYELSTEVDSYAEASGSGDPDFNDAVVLFELQRAEQAEDNFFVHVTVSQVRVEEGS